jgi:hypothetical protein
MNEKIELKIINLEHRNDRKQECIEELKKINIFNTENIFFSAKYDEINGARGASLSHAMLISTYLYESQKEYLLVLEDDFLLTDEKLFLDVINYSISNNNWDVTLFSHNYAIPISNTNNPNILRVINSQTASAYLVGRLYAVKLIEVFFRSSVLLSSYDNLNPPNKDLAKHYFCLDILWKSLQIDDLFLASFPALIKQRESYSDIVKKKVNYNV